MSDIPLIARAAGHANRTALIAPEGFLTYAALLAVSACAASTLLDGADDLRETRVAFLAPTGLDYVTTQWGIWRAGGIAVPLSPLHPRPELEYVIDNAAVEILVAHGELEERLQPIADRRGLRLISTAELLRAPHAPLPSVGPSRRAMILYTSGTTSRPKGVVSTHANIEAQVTSLVSAWGWSPDDSILLVLPLHHVHGIINVLTCALWAGARCHMMPVFNADDVWNRFIDTDLSLFMAVPTIYARLIAVWEAASPDRRAAMTEACARMRLMVSGSAALPVSTLEKWKSISGHVLLERYGMTEIGMALSNPLDGVRRPAHVGAPLPGVEVRLVDEHGNSPPPETPGEIQVRGPNVFLEYWRNPDATHSAFRDGWFRTGDIAVLSDGAYRILGRQSVDIIKTGGYKVSALEIEEVLRTHPRIAECAVVGLDDPEWGQRVCAAIVPAGDDPLALDSLRAWAKERLAVYKVPSRLLTLDDLPRNAMGKITKPAVAQLFQSTST